MKPPIRLFTRIFILTFLTGCTTQPAPDDCVVAIPVTTELEELNLERLNDVPRKRPQREDAVRRYFEEVGCYELTEQSIRYRNGKNILCTVPGRTDHEIVIAAHHDKLGTGDGVADNWTGIVILMALTGHYVQHQPLHTMQFVAFAAEEHDMKGSFHYVRERQRNGMALPRVMINVDTLGVGETRIDARTDDVLGCVARSAAAALNLNLNRTRLYDTTGDWEPFDRAGVPTLHFDSLNRQTLNLLHSYRDRRELVDESRINEAYEIIANTLSALDHSIDVTIN